MQKIGVNQSYSYGGLRRKRRRRRVQPRFFVFLAIMVLLIFLIFLPFLPKSTAAVRMGSVGESVSTTALIVRDEAVQSVKSFGQLHPIAIEGQPVETGDPVIEVFTSSYNDSEKQRLYDVQMQIKALQEGTILRDANSQSLGLIDERVAEKLLSFVAIARGESSAGLLKAEIDLNYLLRDRQQYLMRDGASDRQLAQLLEQEKNIRARMESLKTTVSAEQSGVVSYYLDGLEPVATYLAVEQITVASARTLLKERDVDLQTGVKGDRPIFRIANPGRFALLVILPKNNAYSLDQVVPVRISSASLMVEARVTRVVADSREQLVVLDVDADAAALLSLRKTPVVVGGTQEGLLVPVNALIGDGSAVSLTDDTLVPVRVLARDQKNALIEPISAGALRVGTTVKLQ